MEKKSCFSYSDYRKYIQDCLPIEGEKRGGRSKLAQALGVQTAFVSRVLHEDAHFSLEQAVDVNSFLGHTEAESEYFMLLLQWSRAGSVKLKDFFQKQIDAIQEERQIIVERLQVKNELSIADQMSYYSTWYYSAIHMMLMVKRWQNPQSISNYLGLPLSLVVSVLEFLVRIGLAIEKDGAYSIGTNRIHLGKNSPILLRHHCNWRMRAMQSMDRFSQEDLFFSGPLCLSEKDAKRLREMLLKFLENMEKLIAPSPEEAVFCMGIDYFRL